MSRPSWQTGEPARRVLTKDEATSACAPRCAGRPMAAIWSSTALAGCWQWAVAQWSRRRCARVSDAFRLMHSYLLLLSPSSSSPLHHSVTFIAAGGCVWICRSNCRRACRCEFSSPPVALRCSAMQEEGATSRRVVEQSGTCAHAGPPLGSNRMGSDSGPVALRSPALPPAPPRLSPCPPHSDANSIAIAIRYALIIPLHQRMHRHRLRTTATRRTPHRDSARPTVRPARCDPLALAGSHPAPSLLR